MRFIYYFFFVVLGVVLGLIAIVIAGDRGTTALISTGYYMIGLYIFIYLLTFFLLLKYQTIPYCTMMLNVSPRSAAFFRIRARAYLQRGDFDLALQDLQSAIQLKPRTASVYIGRAFAYLSTRQYKQSLQDFNQAQKLLPNNARVYLGRGMLYLMTRSYQEALQDFDHVLQLPSRSLFANAYMGKAEAYTHLKNYQQALQACEQAFVLAPRKAELYFTRGMVHLAFDQYREALQDAQHFIKISLPSAKMLVPYCGMVDGRVMGHLGCALADMGLKEYQIAIEHVEQAIALDPQCAHSYYVRAIVSLLVNDTERARPDLELSWKMGLRGCSYGLVLAWLDLCQVKPDHAIKESLEAISLLDEMDYSAQISRGVAQWIDGSYEEALATLQQDIDTQSESAFAYFWSGMVCASLGRDDEALAMFRLSLDQHLPPALLAPLRWLEEENHSFYQHHALPLLAMSGTEF